MSIIELIPGVVIDPLRSQAFVMSPEETVSAIDLADGKELWSSSAGAKPLALTSAELVAQVEPKGGAGALELVALNIDDHGSLVSSANVPLSSGVQASISAQPGGRFNAHAFPDGEQVSVSWDFEQRQLGGLDRRREVLPGEEKPTSPPSAAGMLTAAHVLGVAADREVSSSGQVKFTPKTGAVEPIAAPISPDAGPASSIDESLSFEPGVFPSNDGRHLLRSAEKLSDDGTILYSWSVEDVETKKHVVTITERMSYSPFVVVNGKLITVREPYLELDGGALKEFDRAVQAYELGSGELAWRSTVRDTTNRKAPPGSFIR